jgi:dipeptidyl aminopeptidase/acylaminoacyl peptidase
MANASQSLTVETLWRLARPGAICINPKNAEQAIVVVTDYDMDANEAKSRLVRYDLATGQRRDFTQPEKACSEPRWSPDGKYIAFVTKRGKDEQSQIYVIDAQGGEARRVSEVVTGVSGIRWSADGKKIFAISWVWPELTKGSTAAQDKAHTERLKEEKSRKEKGPSAHVIEEDVYKYWDHWLSDGRRPHVFVIEVSSGKHQDLFAGTAYHLPRADTSANDYALSADGRELAFTYNPSTSGRFSENHAIVALDLKTNKFKTLSVEKNDKPQRDCSSPSYSPDGKHLAYISSNHDAHALANAEITLLDRAKGSTTVLSAKFDRDASAPLVWSGDSSAIYFMAESDARQNLYQFTLGEKLPKVVVQGGMVSSFDVVTHSDADTSTIVYVRNTMSSPPEVLAKVNGADRALAALNEKNMAGIKLGKVEELSVKGANGDAVQAWVIYPPNFDPRKKYPLLHNIHGGPHSIWGDNFHFRWNNQLFAANGYVVVCVNYHGSSSFGFEWKRSIDKRWGEQELQDVEATTDVMLKKGFIDPDRLFAAGGSYGGKMVALMNGKLTGKAARYKAYVCHAGCFDWTSMFAADAYYWFPKELGANYWEDAALVAKQNPLTYVKNAKTPTLVIHGELDYRVPVAQGFMYYNTLRAKGVPSRLVYFPDENHWILKPQNSKLWYDEFFAWLKRFDKVR